jgi:type IV pilus biogenesis protein CpaD/CtpE
LKTPPRRKNHDWRSRILLAVLTARLAACATERPPRPAALDPSSPAAAESPRPVIVSDGQPALHATTPEPLPATATTTTATTTTAPTTTAGQPEKAVYTCPMHPEIISNQPGRCPKCGMNLVLKTPAASEGQK